jgi:hypothetical protein
MPETFLPDYILNDPPEMRDRNCRECLVYLPQKQYAPFHNRDKIGFHFPNFQSNEDWFYSGALSFSWQLADGSWQSNVDKLFKLSGKKSFKLSALSIQFFAYDATSNYIISFIKNS